MPFTNLRRILIRKARTYIRRNFTRTPSNSLVLSTIRLKGNFRLRRDELFFANKFPNLIRTAPQIAIDSIKIGAGNQGAIQVEKDYQDAEDIINDHPDMFNRATTAQEFAGLALDDAIFDMKKQSHELWSNRRISRYIADFAYSLSDSPSILEFGCGPAHQFYFFKHFGIWDYIGIDGNPYFVDFNPHLVDFSDHFKFVNLQEPVQLHLNDELLKFNLVTSFEFLEHIQEDKIPIVLESMRSHLEPDGLLMCTASLLDGMDVHVTVKPREWWIEKFDTAGLKPHADSDIITGTLTDSHPFNWDGDTTNVFAMELK